MMKSAALHSATDLSAFLHVTEYYAMNGFQFACSCIFIEIGTFQDVPLSFLVVLSIRVSDYVSIVLVALNDASDVT